MIANYMMAAGDVLVAHRGHLLDKELHQRLEVVQEALSWLGTPFHHQGRVRGAGVDCGMLPMEVYAACGLVPYLETPEYSHDFHLHRGEEFYLQLVEQHAKKVTRSPLPGDLVLFRFGRVLSHGAIVVAWPCIIHSYIQARAVVLDDAEANLDLGQRFEGTWSIWEPRCPTCGAAPERKDTWGGPPTIYKCGNQHVWEGGAA